MQRNSILADARAGRRIGRDRAYLLLEESHLAPLMRTAAAMRDIGHGSRVSYSRKVFIPLTKLCRDTCHYCTFAVKPKPGQSAYLSPDEALEIARRGAAAGCKEALFTLGDKPELRWTQAQNALAAMGFKTTIDYLVDVAGLVHRETGLLPHFNPGVMTREELFLLRPHGVSMGIMLETTARAVREKGGAHYGCPDKEPATRLQCIAEAGRLAIPFTSGLLIGIGETRRDRIDSLLALRDLDDRYGHLQETIIQNFIPKPGTRMASTSGTDQTDHLWSIAVARILLGPQANIQAPPNLSPHALRPLIEAGVNDWGGVSPVTIDHVNPEAPWPAIEALSEATQAAGKVLVERLAIYPTFARDPARWVDANLRPRLLRSIDAQGFAREDGWLSGVPAPIPSRRPATAGRPPSKSLAALLDKCRLGHGLDESEITSLFDVRGPEVAMVCSAADALRRDVSGDVISYVVNRNINYTNVCVYACSFCAFSKGKTHANLRGKPYDLDMGEFGRRVAEAWDRGATEVCLQGGIHPDYTGATYLAILEMAKRAAPRIHVHAFSPLEVWHGASTLGLTLRDYLTRLKAAGLASLPGTAAEILDDEVRAVICPDKLRAAEWFEVVGTAHAIGLRTTATIMFGHVEQPIHWARHLRRIRALQERTGGFTEFVPLPFVAHEAPIFLRNGARRGPTFREAVLMHAVARLALHPVIPNIQTSWVKMGPDGARACLEAGANDLGGTLMNESITRAAGALHGQEFAPAQMEALIQNLGREPKQRMTHYGRAEAERIRASFRAAPLDETINTPVRRKARPSIDLESAN